jgi:hypothetical protein
MDVIGPFPECEGKKLILVVQDYFSKWIELYPLENQEAVTVADVLVNDCVTRFGIPWSLHSDQGPNFESKVNKILSETLGILKSRTSLVTLCSQEVGNQ